MNKQQFLSELNQYLTFITAEERALVMEEYHGKFDAAGAEGEAALILQLGTPMMIAIALKRRKEAGEPLTEHAVPASKPEAEESEPSPAEAEESAEAAELSAEKEAEAEDITGDGEIDQSEDESDPEPPQREEKPRIKAGAMVSCVLLSIITAAVALLVSGIGVYFIVIMGNLLVTALQNLNQLNDSLLLFAGGLVSGGIGIVIVWLGIWSAIRIISKLAAKTRA